MSRSNSHFEVYEWGERPDPEDTPGYVLSPQELLSFRLFNLIIDNRKTNNSISFLPQKFEKEFECPISGELHKTGYVLPCGHKFSDEILKWSAKTCPYCRTPY